MLMSKNVNNDVGKDSPVCRDLLVIRPVRETKISVLAVISGFDI